VYISIISGVKITISGPNAKNGMGRVDVMVDGTLGTICREDWDNRDAAVLCRQLNYSDGEALTGRLGRHGNMSWQSTQSNKSRLTTLKNESWLPTLWNQIASEIKVYL
jgi:hypothetical protein